VLVLLGLGLELELGLGCYLCSGSHPEDALVAAPSTARDDRVSMVVQRCDHWHPLNRTGCFARQLNVDQSFSVVTSYDKE
jgi:hypothetical protein